jgi:uncharacterized protein YndB with AHSA1/START domain
MPSIHHRVFIGAPAEKVYHAITRQEGLAAWWTPDAKAKAELNSILHFPFDVDYFKEMKITLLEPYTHVKWICIPGADEWIGTTTSFRLRPGDKETLLREHPEMSDQLQQAKNSDNGTVLIFSHDEWKKETPMFAECNYTWAQFLRSLKLFCETGKGCPWPKQHTTV